MERAYFSIKFKDDIESLNTDDFLSAIPKIERENVMKPNFNLKFDVFSNTFYLWIEILKTCIGPAPFEDEIFLCKSKSEGETIWQ